MSDKMTGPAVALEQEFAALTAFVMQASEKISAGIVVDMEEMDQKVTVLCAEVQKAGNDIARQMQEPMAALITGLDQLAQDLSEYQNKVKER